MSTSNGICLNAIHYLMRPPELVRLKNAYSRRHSFASHGVEYAFLSVSKVFETFKPVRKYLYITLKYNQHFYEEKPSLNSLRTRIVAASEAAQKVGNL